MEPQDKLIVSKALDAIDIAERQYIEKSVGFLDPHQKTLIAREIFDKVPRDMKTEFFGGYDDAERQMFLCYPDYLEPDYNDLIVVFEIVGRDIADLTHRDYLGSFMALGIKRENIGDILPFEDRCFIFIRPEIARYITENLTKIGSRGIKIYIRKLTDIKIPKKETELDRVIVSGFRVDCIVSSVLNLSRTKASEIINSDRVKVNFATVSDGAKKVKEGDLISVRNFGRFRFLEISGITRKGRHSIIIERYL